MLKNTKIRTKSILSILFLVVTFVVSAQTVLAQGMEKMDGMEIDDNMTAMVLQQNPGFVWQNMNVMIAFDVVFIVLLLLTIFIYFRSSLRRVAQGASMLILSGFAILALFFAIDLYIMLFSEMKGMLYLHLTGSWFFLLISFSLLLGGFYMLSHGLANRIFELKKVAVAIAQGNMDVEIDTTGKDEIGELSQAIDRMRQSLKVVFEAYDTKVK